MQEAKKQMNWFKIRRAQPEDKEEMHRIECACFAIPWAADDLIKDATDNILAVYYVCEVGTEPPTKLAGYAGVWVVIDEGHITNVAVDREYRKQGVATHLIQQLMKTAAEKGAKKITLEVKRTNRTAIALYERFGFRIVGYRERYYQEDGEDAAIMWATIADDQNNKGYEEKA